MHGAREDILWLQRDFGIYVAGLFDTSLASLVLGHETNALTHLLRHYCGVTVRPPPPNNKARVSFHRIRRSQACELGRSPTKAR